MIIKYLHPLNFRKTVTGKKNIFPLVFLLLFVIHRPVICHYKVLGYGMKGNTVTQIQEWLNILGYLKHKPTGYFGPLTSEAVKSFQKEQGISVDGLVGTDTLYRLNEAFIGTQPKDEGLTGELVPWVEANKIFPIGSVAKITDLETGLSFKIFRHGGYLHADCEPYTPADTAVMFAVYKGVWSWQRRAVIIQLGSRKVAGSVNGMPHGRFTIKNNNFPGHFCLHFYNSRLHKNNRLDSAHQRMIFEAYGKNR